MAARALAGWGAASLILGRAQWHSLYIAQSVDINLGKDYRASSVAKGARVFLSFFAREEEVVDKVIPLGFRSGSLALTKAVNLGPGDRYIWNYHSAWVPGAQVHLLQ